jgi:hypothetical protein
MNEQGRAMLGAMESLAYIEDNELELSGKPNTVIGEDLVYCYVVRSSRQSSEDTGPYFEGTGLSVAEAVYNFKANVRIYANKANDTHERKMALVLRLIGADIGIGD